MLRTTIIWLVAIATAAGLGVAWRQARTRQTMSGSVSQAENWLAPNLQPGSRIIADSQVRAALLAARWPSPDLATPDAPSAQWPSYDFLVSTPVLRATPTALARAALPNTTLIASFGAGDQRTDILRVDPAGRNAAQDLDASLVRFSARTGQQITSNSRIQFEAEAGIQAANGDADPRLLALLVALGAQHPVTVLRFINAPSEGATFGQLHALTLSTVDGVPVTQSGTQTQSVANWFAAQHGPYRATTLGVDSQGNLIIAIPFVPAATSPD